MAYTENNNLENQTDGQADWDSGLNANFTIMDRGFHGRFAVGMAIASGDILWCASGGVLYKYDPKSLSLGPATAMSYKAINSGETDHVLLRGTVSSISPWSGNIIPGKPVFVSPSTTGFAVASYAAADYPVGMALSNTALYFSPGQYRTIPEEITQVQSLGPLAIGSTHHATLNVGNRGVVRNLFVMTSMNNWSLKLYSGSSAVNSELLYESQSGNVTSTQLLDAALFPYKNTDTASLGMVFAKIAVNSGVGSAYFNMSVTAERFR